MEMGGSKGMGWWAFVCKRGGVDTPLWLDTPPKGSIDGARQILPRLTPGPGGYRTQNLAKMEMEFWN